MKDLIRNIFCENYVAAEESFQSHMQEIVERKSCEMKKMMQTEAVGGKSPEDVRKDPKYRGRASEVLGTTGTKRRPGQLLPADSSQAQAARAKTARHEMDWKDRYKADISRAKDLEARGSTSAVGKVQRAYGKHAAKELGKTALKGALSGALGALEE